MESTLAIREFKKNNNQPTNNKCWQECWWGGTPITVHSNVNSTATVENSTQFSKNITPGYLSDKMKTAYKRCLNTHV